jgi:hypothetical protein
MAAGFSKKKKNMAADIRNLRPNADQKYGHCNSSQARHLST